MSSTGIMGDSGDFRTNPSNHDHGSSGGGAFSSIGKVFGHAMDRRRQESQAQFGIAANLVNNREQRDFDRQESQRGRVYNASEAAAVRQYELDKMGKQADIEAKASAQKHAQTKDLATVAAPGSRVQHTQGDHTASFTTPKAPAKPRASRSAAAKPATRTPIKPAAKTAAKAPIKPVGAPRTRATTPKK